MKSSKTNISQWRLMKRLLAFAGFQRGWLMLTIFLTIIQSVLTASQPYLYKIVIDQQTGAVAGWQFPHTKPYVNLGNDLTKFRMPISQIQTAAGVNFKFPAGAKELQPGQEWPVDYGALTNAKRAVCGKNAD